jgi:hypothetical protein
MRRILCLTAVFLIVVPQAGDARRRSAMSRTELVQAVIERTRPLPYPRGDRLPLYVWSLEGLGTEDEVESEEILSELDARGMAVFSTWSHGRMEQSLAEGLRVGALQKKLGLRVNVSVNPLLHHFCNGDPSTAHVSETGEPFFDLSFSRSVKMGCPFALQSRYPEIRARVESFAKAYSEAGVGVDFSFADWEIDGAMEWNAAWETAKACRRCREQVPDIDDFTSFQRAVREIRSEMQREAYADVMVAHFPDAKVGNYAVYPHDGYRYWYDYFETFVEGAPFKAEVRAKYRQWFHEFPLTGYTVAMPVVYPWAPISLWYDFENAEYGWFYNMLLVASNAGEHRTNGVPVVSFVHWEIVDVPTHPGLQTEPLSKEIYQEVLWHMLLRGHDTFFMWCPRDATIEELVPVHEVYAASTEYSAFLREGVPVTFEVPREEGPVVSAVQLGKRLLVRRTDFTDHPGPVPLRVDGQTVDVPRAEGRCQVVEIE